MFDALSPLDPNHLMICFRILIAASLTLGLSVPSKGAAPAAPAPEAKPTDSASKSVLTGTLVDPINVDLNWKTDLPNVEGHFVEYTSDPKDDWVILGILSADTSTYRHPDLAPETKFIYRVRPYFGKPSKVAEVTTGKTPANPGEGLEGDNEPVADKPDAEALAKKKSLRDPGTSAEAAPVDFTITPVSPVSMKLSWKDMSKDEDGYLLEGTSDPALGFAVIGFFPANTVSFIIPNLPPNTKCFFRTRAFYYGPASNSVEKTTGQEPPGYFQKKEAEAAAAEAEAQKAAEAKAKAAPAVDAKAESEVKPKP